jgi:hypothetical protein
MGCGPVSAFQRWQFRTGRPRWSARVMSRLLGIVFAAGLGPNQAATIEIRGRKTGRTISFPVVVVPYEGERYLVAMLGDKTNWVRNLRADNHAVLQRRTRRTCPWWRTSPAIALRSCTDISSSQRAPARSFRSTAGHHCATLSGSSANIQCFGSPQLSEEVDGKRRSRVP